MKFHRDPFYVGLEDKMWRDNNLVVYFMYEMHKRHYCTPETICDIIGFSPRRLTTIAAVYSCKRSLSIQIFTRLFPLISNRLAPQNVVRIQRNRLSGDVFTRLWSRYNSSSVSDRSGGVCVSTAANDLRDILHGAVPGTWTDFVVALASIMAGTECERILTRTAGPDQVSSRRKADVWFTHNYYIYVFVHVYNNAKEGRPSLSHRPLSCSARHPSSSILCTLLLLSSS